MAFVSNGNENLVGKWITLKRRAENSYGYFSKGSRVKITRCWGDVFDIEDANGNVIREVPCNYFDKNSASDTEFFEGSITQGGVMDRLSIGTTIRLVLALLCCGLAIINFIFDVIPSYVVIALSGLVIISCFIALFRNSKKLKPTKQQKERES